MKEETLLCHRYGYGGGGMVQRGDGGFGTVLLFLLAAGALVWFVQGQGSAGGMSLGALSNLIKTPDRVPRGSCTFQAVLELLSSTFISTYISLMLYFVPSFANCQGHI